MLKLVLSLAAFILVLGASNAAVAASGTAMGVDPAATRLKGDTRTLDVGDDIFIGDRVVTGASGQVQILFSDKTELVVGPRSALLIEDYLLRDDGSAGKLAINVLGGTFRFVTGGSPKNRYIIETPSGTIGVRGTGLEGYATGDALYILSRHGSVIGCPPGVPLTSPRCAIADDECEYMVVTAGGAEIVGHTDEIKGDERERLKKWFKYAVSESSLLRSFRIQGDKCFSRTVQPGAGSLVDLPDFGRRPRDADSTNVDTPFIDTP